MDLLKRLTETPGVPGREERVRALIEKETRGLFSDTRTDAMGNLICHRQPDRRAGRGAGRKIMLACHIDEIGFYVKYIDDKGFLRLNPAGGFDTRNLFARRVLVQGKKDLVGVLNPAGRPLHIATEEEKKKTYKVGEFFVDLFLPVEQVKKLVTVGDPVTLIQTTEVVGDAVTGKCMDNRVASYVALEAIRRAIKGRGTANEIYYVATVQEEVGCRGAGPATFGIEPDVALAIDTTLCCDTPGIAPDEAVSSFGAGTAIKIMDGNSISDRSLVDEFIALAKAKRIKYQLEILPLGGTDAGPVQRTRTGYKTATLSVPTRYIHTVTETVHKDDLEASINLLAAFLAK